MDIFGGVRSHRLPPIIFTVTVIISIISMVTSYNENIKWPKLEPSTPIPFQTENSAHIMMNRELFGEANDLDSGSGSGEEFTSIKPSFTLHYSSSTSLTLQSSFSIESTSSATDELVHTSLVHPTPSFSIMSTPVLSLPSNSAGILQSSTETINSSPIISSTSESFIRPTPSIDIVTGTSFPTEIHTSPMPTSTVQTINTTAENKSESTSSTINKNVTSHPLTTVPATNVTTDSPSSVGTTSSTVNVTYIVSLNTTVPSNTTLKSSMGTTSITENVTLHTNSTASSSISTSFTTNITTDSGIANSSTTPTYTTDGNATSSTPKKGGGMFNETTQTIGNVTSTQIPIPDQKYWIKTQIRSSDGLLQTKNIHDELEEKLWKMFKYALEKFSNHNTTRMKRYSQYSNLTMDNNTTKEANQSEISIQMLTMLLDSIKNDIQLVYVVYLNGTPILAKTAVDYVNRLSMDEVTKIMGYEVLMTSVAVEEPPVTAIPRKYNPQRKYQSDEWIIFVCVGVGSAVLSILIISTIVYRRCKKHPGRRRSLSPIDNFPSSSHRPAIFGNLNRQKVNVAKNKKYDTGSEKNNKKDNYNDVIRKDNTDVDDAKKTAVQFHATNLGPKNKLQNKGNGCHVNEAFELDESSVGCESNRYQIPPKKPPKRCLTEKTSSGENQDECNISPKRRSRKPVDERAPEVPGKINKEELFGHVQFSGPKMDDYDPTVLNKAENNTGPYPPSETYNMKVHPQTIPISHCTTSESTDYPGDIPPPIPDPDYLANDEISTMGNVEEMRTRINELLDESFGLTSDKNRNLSASNPGLCEKIGKKEGPNDDHHIRTNSLNAHKTRNVSSAPVSKSKNGLNSQLPTRGRRPRDSRKYTKLVPQSCRSKVVWTPYTAGDETAKIESAQFTNKVPPSHLENSKPRKSKIGIIDNDGKAKKRASNEQEPLFKKHPHMDEIDIVSSLKSVQFEPAESVIRAIKNELKKYDG